jgi:hypothetical protein
MARSVSPACCSRSATRMFGDGAVRIGAGGRAVLQVGAAVVEAAPHAAVAAELGSAAPDAAGRGDHLAVLGLKVRDLAETEMLLRGNRVPATATAGLVRVPAGAAMNTTIDFMA